jgi:hypothetical protein
MEEISIEKVSDENLSSLYVCLFVCVWSVADIVFVFGGCV